MYHIFQFSPLFKTATLMGVFFFGRTFNRTRVGNHSNLALCLFFLLTFMFYPTLEKSTYPQVLPKILDFRQIPAVVAFGGETETSEASIVSSLFYRDNAKRQSLPFDQDHEKYWWSFLFQDGRPHRRWSSHARWMLMDWSPLTVYRQKNDIEPSIDYVFPPDVLNGPVLCATRGIITSQNTTVDEINNLALSSIGGSSCSWRDQCPWPRALRVRLGRCFLYVGSPLYSYP